MYKHDYWITLDQKFGTEPNSPLHHDNRCQTCQKGK